MRIAIMGTRGIPANYGGFETFAEELSWRLAERGHDVTVYGRSHHVRHEATRYRGVRLVVLPTIRHKYFDTIAHTALSAVHSLREHYDVVLVCNGANAPFAWLPRLVGAKVTINVDGIERQRKKWGAIGRAYYRGCERLSTIVPDVMISDADVIQEYYRTTYGKDSVMIPYGTPVGRHPMPDVVRSLGLEPERYVLYVSRLEPENNAHKVIEAFEGVDANLELAIVGGAPYASDYIARLKSTRDPRIKFLGFVYGDGYRALQQSAFAYVQATEVGGTHPALIEAMGYGNCVLAYGTPENTEVLGGAGFVYDSVEQLRAQLQQLARNPEMRIPAQESAMHRAGRYSWETITDRYEALFHEMVSPPASRARGIPGFGTRD
jgi:glycosyltransferase involved in cell wall biosynthesis